MQHSKEFDKLNIINEDPRRELDYRKSCDYVNSRNDSTSTISYGKWIYE